VEERTVRVVIDEGHVASVDRVVQAVERCWTRWQTGPALPAPHFHQHGGLRLPAGLVPELVRELERDGYRVEVDDRRRDDLDADAQVLEQAQGADRRYLEAVARSRVGVVEVADHRELVNGASAR
jgi:hypothetical protein